jgi:hypothetical protein
MADDLDPHIENYSGGDLEMQNASEFAPQEAPEAKD